MGSAQKNRALMITTTNASMRAALVEMCRATVMHAMAAILVTNIKTMEIKDEEIRFDC